MVVAVSNQYYWLFFLDSVQVLAYNAGLTVCKTYIILEQPYVIRPSGQSLLGFIMKIQNFQAKEHFKKYKVSVPDGGAVFLGPLVETMKIGHVRRGRKI